MLSGVLVAVALIGLLARGNIGDLLIQKIICCLSEIHISLGTLGFYLPNLAALQHTQSLQGWLI